MQPHQVDQLMLHSLEDLYHERTPTETDINDLFWFEEKFLCECIGLDFEEYEERVNYL